MKKSFVMLTVAALTVARGFSQEDILPRPPKPIPAGNDLARLIRDTRLGEPYQHKSLTVFPLFTSGAAARGYWTLDPALAKGVLRITEKGEGSVPQLLAENRADEPVFLMAGEIVTGGRQNRVISQDILLPPRSGPISLGVFCVEQGRWTTQSQYFTAEKEMAHEKLREQLNAPATSQSEVWGEVARKSAAVAPSRRSSSGYLGDLYEDRSVRRGLDEYSKAIRLPSDANGMAVMMGGRVVGVELFSDGETFARLRDKLLRSYAVDALEAGTTERLASGRERVEGFLRSAQSAPQTPKETIGLGRLFSIEGREMYGSVLLWHEQDGAHGVVHASLFAERSIEDRPTPKPLPRE